MDIALITEKTTLVRQFNQFMRQAPAEVIRHKHKGGVNKAAERWIRTDDLTSTHHSLLFAKVHVDGVQVKFIEAVGCVKDIEDKLAEWIEWAQPYWDSESSSDDSDEQDPQV